MTEKSLTGLIFALFIAYNWSYTCGLSDAVKCLHLCGQTDPLMESCTWSPDRLQGLSTTNKRRRIQGGHRFSLIARTWRILSGLVGELYVEQMDQSGTNKGCAFPCMGKQTRTLGQNNAVGTDPCFGGRGPRPLKVLWSQRRISQITLLLLCHRYGNLTCAACSRNQTFPEDCRFLLPSATS